MVKKNILIILGVVLLVAGAGGVFAQICEAPTGYNCWYVSTTGDDSNDGSFENPFATIQYAVDNMNGGDIVYLREGTYYESGIYINPITKSGNPNSPSILKSYPGEWAILDGEWDCSAHCRAIICQNPTAKLEYWTFANLEIMRGGLIPETDFDKSGPSGIHFYETKNIKIRNCYIHDCQGWHGQNPGGITANVPEKMLIEYCYFKDNGCTDNGNCANIIFMSDYKDTTPNDFDPNRVTKENEIRYNLLDGSCEGFKHKNQQIFGEQDRDPNDMTYKNWGDKIHHNIIRSASSGAESSIEAQQDFCQVYNNILEEKGIFIKKYGSDAEVFHTVVYNNVMMNAGVTGIHISGLGTSVDFKPYSYLYNNIVENSAGDYRRKDISMGTTINSGNNPIGVINLENCPVENNYVYRPQSPDHYAVGRVMYWEPEDSWFTTQEFNENWNKHNYKNFYDVNNLLFQGTSGADQYKTRSAHILEGSTTIADGGIGGAHPYLSGVTIPSYVGATNPNDNDWVGGVLSLTNTNVLMNGGSGDPSWIEGYVVSDTCQSLGYQCCDSCETGTEQSAYDGDCVAQVCCGACSSSTCGPADTSGDNIVDIIELMNYIGEWKSGSVTITELMNGIGEWKNGC